MRSNILFLASCIIRHLPSTRCFAIKRYLYKLAGAKIGCNVRISSSVKIIGTGNLKIGDNTWIGEDVTIICTSDISIGKNCDIAPRVYIGTGTHEIDIAGDHIAGRGISKPVSIGDGCWLCVNSVVLPGVSIGPKSIVAAGAIVTRKHGEYCVIGGVPATTLKIMNNE